MHGRGFADKLLISIYLPLVLAVEGDTFAMLAWAVPVNLTKDRWVQGKQFRAAADRRKSGDFIFKYKTCE